MIHDAGLPAGIGSHIPEVIQYAEEKGWETDFYMACFYNSRPRLQVRAGRRQRRATVETFPSRRPAAHGRNDPRVQEAVPRLQDHGRQPQLRDARRHQEGAPRSLPEHQAHGRHRRRMFPKHRDQVAETPATCARYCRLAVRAVHDWMYRQMRRAGQSRARKAKQGVSVMDTTRETDEALRSPPQADAWVQAIVNCYRRKAGTAQPNTRSLMRTPAEAAYGPRQRPPFPVAKIRRRATHAFGVVHHRAIRKSRRALLRS